jgi:hypothetical protein
VNKALSNFYSLNCTGTCKLIALVKALIIFILLSLVLDFNAFSQPIAENTVYQPYIKSVEFYNTAKQASFPLITLNSGEKLLLAFDDLTAGTRDFSYTIEHCDENWNSSNLATAEYLQNYTDDKITNYSYSTGTLQKYTHYELKLPNENIAPKIAGNYILKVYEDGDPSKLILTRRLYVVKPEIIVSAEVAASVNYRQTNQKINFTLNYGSLRVQNPEAEINTVVMQNAVSETSQVNTEPTNINGIQLVFNEVNANDFPGGNEFRHLDTRSLKLNSDRVQHIYRDSNTVVLLTDPDRNQPDYSFQYDLNGSFYILNQDGTDPRIDADYTHTIFSFTTKKPANEGDVYIVGQFNGYNIDQQSKMVFDKLSGKYLASLFLKQGVYDYEYVWVDKTTGKPDLTTLEGSHFETENDYQLLVYYKPAGARWEELVGYKLLNAARK